MLTFYTFIAVASVTIFSALKVVFSRNPVYSVLYLIVTFVCITIHYFLLNSQFLAMVHIIVYAGAIMVLFLYMLMMLNLNRDIEPKKPLFAKIGAISAAGLLALVLCAAMRDTDKLTTTHAGDDSIGLISNLGRILYNDYMIPFEVSSVLFLTGMVGAVMLGKRENAA